MRVLLQAAFSNACSKEFNRLRLLQGFRCYSSAEPNVSSSIEDEEFKPLTIINKSTRQQRRRRDPPEVSPPRYRKMSVTQDWPSVWPVARTFHPASVPLPLHQGYVPANKAVPNKWGNLELMKIPNFLHLTPPAIQRHTEALKKFCTPWPENLETQREIGEEFPITIVTSDYCHSTPSIRDHRSRIVTLQFKLSTLPLDEHARDKFLRLIGDRHDAATDLVTIVTDACPMRKQNLDYAYYLLTALYHESLNVEPWEDEKLEEDMEKYVWDASESKKRIVEILGDICTSDRPKPSYLKDVSSDKITPETVSSFESVVNYSEATTRLHNTGETDENLTDYGHSVRKLFNLPAP